MESGDTHVTLRYKKGMQMELTVLCFGGGQDSTALLLLYIHDLNFRLKYAPGDLLVVMSSTGNEHETTDRHVEYIKDLCSRHGIRFEYLSFDRGYHSGPWKTGLVDFYRGNNRIGTVAFSKTCSINLKIEPCRRFLKEYCAEAVGFSDPTDCEAVKTYVARSGSKIKLLIGFAAGEEKRRSTPDRLKWIRDCLETVYPLIELGFDRDACQRYIASVGEKIPSPSNCIICHFKSPLEILLTKRRYPEVFAIWEELEANKIAANLHIGTKNYYVNKTKSLATVAAEAAIKYASWSDADLNQYWMTHGHACTTSF